VTDQRSGRSGWVSRLDPKLAAALAYVGGPISGAVFLILERTDPFVRFHALQSVVTFGGVAVLHLVLRNLPLVAWLSRSPLMIATFALWIFLIIKAFSGDRYRLPFVADLVDRFLHPPPR